ncbi:MAG: DUF3102 domain-containing protein [Chroococcidiopsidaceae cyanobacterium CP_BM_RX_35]|nr:DUF3102 domain-containing protein [Chroococcidiopsidaceae cyanobacterium CP_BM_RX_35]
MPTSNHPPARKEFDYNSLDAETSAFIQQQTDEIRGLVKRTAQGILEIGQKLIDIKGKLGHGQFGNWLAAEFTWSWVTANRFMNVAKYMGQIHHNEEFDSRALYLLSAPSTPENARAEAIARAQTGEFITYAKAKAIKQKYALPTKSKPRRLLKSASQPKTESLLQIPLSLSPPSQPSIKQEIIAIRPQATAAVAISQPAATTPAQPGIWWQLGGKHLLYCGDPNSDEFLEQVTEAVQLLLAFPPTRGWQPAIQARTRIIADEYLPQGKDIRLFEDTLETNLLLYSNLEDLVVSCFLPSLEILSIINRLDRRGLLAEPDARRCNTVITDWKRAGLKTERVTDQT